MDERDRNEAVEPEDPLKYLEIIGIIDGYPPASVDVDACGARREVSAGRDEAATLMAILHVLKEGDIVQRGILKELKELASLLAGPRHET